MHNRPLGRPERGDGRSGPGPDSSQQKTYEAPDIHDHLVALDALQGIAIIWVVMLHVTSHWALRVGPVEVFEFDVPDDLRFPGSPCCTF